MKKQSYEGSKPSYRAYKLACTKPIFIGLYFLQGKLPGILMLL